MKYNNIFSNKDGGIYKITNLINNKAYIGRTNNFYKRFRQYQYSFKNRKSKHLNEYMLRSAEKYGIDNFIFETLVICSLEESLDLENIYMDKFKTTDRNFGYNMRKDSLGGMITAPETSKKISNRLKKEWSEGKRSGHSEKLTKSWDNRNREDQSKLLTKNLTKYYYIMNNEMNNKLTYKDLVKMKCSSIISSFYRNKSDDIIYKSINFKRFKIND